jgi:leucyl-tRNA synthetase
VSTLLLAPICPHTCEHVWSNLLKREGLVVNGEGGAALLAAVDS